MTIQNTSPATPGEVESSGKIQADSQHGVFDSWWQLAIGMGESTATFGFGIAQDTRSELRRRTDLTLTFAEEMAAGTFRFVKKVVDRVDRVTGDVLGRGEASMLVVTRAMRKTGHGVAELASTAIADTIGPPQSGRKESGRAAAAA